MLAHFAMSDKAANTKGSMRKRLFSSGSGSGGGSIMRGNVYSVTAADNLKKMDESKQRPPLRKTYSSISSWFSARNVSELSYPGIRSSKSLRSLTSLDHSRTSTGSVECIPKGETVVLQGFARRGTLYPMKTSSRGLFFSNLSLPPVESNASVHSPVVLNAIRERRGFSPPKQCRALYSYAPDQDDELELREGDVVSVLEKVEDGWWRGTLGNRCGVFPSNFVEDIAGQYDNNGGSRRGPQSLLPRRQSNRTAAQENKVSKSVPKLPPKPALQQKCVVLFKHEAVNADELSLVEGQVVNIVTKNVEDEGWWKGEVDGRIGLFPNNFVAIINYASSNLQLSSQEIDNIAWKNGFKIEVKAEGRRRGSAPAPSLRSPSRERKTASGGFGSSSNVTPALFKTTILVDPTELPPTVDPQQFAVSQADISGVNSELAADLNSVKVESRRLIHLTTGRVRAPKRRPPSSAHVKGRSCSAGKEDIIDEKEQNKEEMSLLDRVKRLEDLLSELKVELESERASRKSLEAEFCRLMEMPPRRSELDYWRRCNDREGGGDTYLRAGPHV